MKRFLPIIFVALLFSCTGKSEFNLTSPDSKSRVNMEIRNEKINLSTIYNSDTLIRKIEIGILSNDSSFVNEPVISDFKEETINETWETVNGKNMNVVNHYNSYKYNIVGETGKQLNLEIRLYNQGFAYRLVFPSAEGKITEMSQFNCAEENVFWAYNGENHNIGPENLSTYPEKVIRNPVVFQTQNQKFFAIHEAAIFNHAPFTFTKSGENSLLLKQELFSENRPVKSSWRAFIFGDRPGDLVESDLLVNLNEPCKIEDTSWIKPGKSMWDWRVWGYTAADGFEYGLNTISHKRFIDFAAENNIQYLLIDADWYGPEFDDSSDPTNAREGVDIEECMSYAKQKGVGVILYLNDVGARKFGLERILKQFSEWEAVGVKYGFMRGTPREKVLNTRRIVELCAKYQLMVNFHDNPVPPSGDRRTWPNLITKEFGHSQADAKRSYFPETAVTAPFVNMIAGPLDLCNGWFDLENAFDNGRHKVFEEIPGTVAAEVAKLIVVYGGIYVLPDAPEEYLKKGDLFDCIRQMPAQFDSFKVLAGEIGKYISVARSAGDEWFVGSLTNRNSRELDINLDFLEAGKKYIATFYEDSPDTHFLKNKEAYRVVADKTVSSESVIKIKMAPGGGHSMRIRPLD